MSALEDSSRLRRVMVGWLYADLTLVLFIASMGQFRTPAPAEAKPRPSVSPSPRPTPKPTPTPTPTTRERMGLAPKAITFTVRVDRRDGATATPERSDVSSEMSHDSWSKQPTSTHGDRIRAHRRRALGWPSSSVSMPISAQPNEWPVAPSESPRRVTSGYLPIRSSRHTEVRPRLTKSSTRSTSTGECTHRRTRSA